MTGNDRPRPFSVYTAKELWTDEHTSEQMLAFHLNGDIDISSRRTAFINDSVNWMAQHFDLGNSSRVVDFGCGPGLYTTRFAPLGAETHGIDFSSRSIDYAKAIAKTENLEIAYVEADYLDYEPDGCFDLIVMIMCDFCALSPTQRAAMLAKFENRLSEKGHVILDVYSLRAYDDKQEGTVREENQLDGFWSKDPYVGILTSFKYGEEKVSLDRYTIVENDRQRDIYNWLQYFTPESLQREVQAAGLEIVETYGDVAGGAYDPDATEFAVVMQRA